MEPAPDTGSDPEQLRIYDARFDPIGVESRPFVHRDGCWHETFHCWIVTGPVHDGRLLLQMRSASKDVWPSRFDATGGGHLAPGEAPREGALRELQEEVGLLLDASQLVPVGVRIGVDEFVQGVKNYEFLHVYLVRLPQTPVEWNLQKSEVASVVEARIQDLLRLFAEESEHVAGAERAVATAERAPQTVQIRCRDFPETLDDYYYKVAILAERMLRGDAHLRI